MRKILLFLSLLLNSILAYSQYSDWEPYNFPDTLSSDYLFDPEATFNEAIQITDKKKVDVKRYAEAIAYNRQDDFIDGTLYIGWKELEDYLNEILYRIYPEAKNSSIHVYIARDPFFNACAFGDGRIYLNIGALHSLKDEASLAMIIGHELAHYLNGDSKDTYMNYLKLQRKFKYSLLPNKWVLNYYLYSREQEINADNKSFELLSSAGYDLKSVYHTYHIMDNCTKLAEYKGFYLNYDNRFSTHPTIQARVDNLDSYIKNLSKSNSINNLVDGDLFLKYRIQSHYETLYLLHDTYSTNLSLEYAFSNYLYNNEDTLGIYYILEALRRILLIDKNLGDNTFLSENFTSLHEKETIFSHIEYLYPDSTDRCEIIKKNDLLINEETPFITYIEAFEYFKNIAEELNVNESNLTLALYHHERDNEKRDYYIDKYISSNGKYIEYARYLRSGGLYASDSKNNLLVIGNAYNVENHFYGKYNRFRQSDSFRSELNDYTLELTDNYFENFTVIDYKTHSVSNLNEVTSIFNIVGKIKSLRRSNIDIDILLFNPEYWYLFKKYNINSLRYFDCIDYFDATQNQKNIVLYVLVPLIWAGKLISKNFHGTYQHSYNIYFQSITPFNGKSDYFDKSLNVRYKLRKRYFQNSLYQLISKDNE